MGSFCEVLRPRILLLFLCGGIWAFQYTCAQRSDPAAIPKGPMYYGRCRMVFNELNLAPSSENQFIELKKICEGDVDRNTGVSSIQKYKILFVDSDGSLVVVCKLSGDTIRSNGKFFYVLGGDGIPSASMRMSSCHFAEDYPATAEGRFPLGEYSAVGIILVHNEKESVLQDLDLENRGTAQAPRWRKVQITSGGKIMKYLQDMAIVTSSSPYTECKFFQNFYSGYRPGQRTILRDWGQTLYNDRSLSRCPSSEDGINQFRPLQPQLFAVAQRSPGEENICNGAVKFFVEDSQPQRKRPRLDFTDRPGHECVVTTEDHYIDRFNLIINPLVYSTMLQLAIDAAQNCARDSSAATTSEAPQEAEEATSDTSPVLGADNDAEVYLEDAEFEPRPVPMPAFEESLRLSGPFLYQSCDEFPQQDLIAELKSPGWHSLDWRDILEPQTCTWFEYLGLQLSPSMYRAPKFRCKICHRLLSQGIIMDRPRSKYVNKIMKNGQGVGGQCAKYDNKKIIQKHLKNPLHEIAMDFIALFEQGYRGEELKNKFMEKGRPYRNFLQKTENLFITCFQGVKLDITFFKFEVLRELQTYFGVDLGHLYNNPAGMKLITLSISETMHSMFVEQLKIGQPEFSLLLDLSTDVSSLAAAAFLFQTYDENHNIRIYLYRVVWVPEETSEEIFAAFQREIVRDGLEDYVRQKCVGYASDSGSNVLKFREYLQRMAEHQLIATRCFAHRLENAHKAAWKNQPYLMEVDKTVNEVYRIFHRSAKKKRVLQIQQVDLGDDCFELKRYHAVRWIAGKRRALLQLLQHWRTVVQALQEISNDRTFKLDQRTEAEAVLNVMKDPKFISTLAFSSDVSEAIAEMSMGMQNRGTTLIGKKKMRDDVTKKLQKLKTTNGKHLKEVLDLATPVDEDDPTYTTSLEDFERRNIRFRSNVLNNANPQAPDLLHKKRMEYIDDVLLEISNRFPADPSDGFDIFDCHLWPERKEDLEAYGNNRIQTISREMLWNFDGQQLVGDWKLLKESVKDHPEFENRKNDMPEEFWAFYLQEEGVNWPASLKTIITNIITAPASTAEVERIFSFYTATKTMRRYRLDVSTVDAIIRIKFNGPKSLKEFDAISYIPSFLKAHARSDDDSFAAKRKRLFRGANEDLVDDEIVEDPPDTEGL